MERVDGRQMTVAVFGTFDIGNYGDLLFPYVLKEKLAQVDGSLRVELYSYREKTEADWIYPVRPIERYAQDVRDTAVAVIGGGHLVHFDKRMAPGYVPSDADTPHPLGFWWLPAVYSHCLGVPVLAHGLSVDRAIPDYAPPLLSTFVASLTGGGLRDDQSRQRLEPFGLGAEVGIVPDSIFSVADCVPAGVTSDRFEQWRADQGLEGPYVILQPSPGLRRFARPIRALVEQARARGWTILELPIGRELRNAPGYYAFDDVDVRSLTSWPDPLLLTEIIAHAEASIGISLHLSVVSAVYSVPVFRPSYSPESKYVVLDGIPSVQAFSPEDEPTLVGAHDDEFDNEPVLAPKREALDRHWQMIASRAAAGQGQVPRRAQPELWTVLGHGAQRVHDKRGAGDRLQDANKALLGQRSQVVRRLFPRLS